MTHRSQQLPGGVGARPLADARPELSDATTAPRTGVAPLTRLSHLACLAIDGDDARAFLHAQLTNDVRGLQEGHWIWAGYCSPKGRLLGVARVACGSRGFVAETSADIAEDLAARLRRFILRSKVRLTCLSGTWIGLGASGGRAAEVIERHFGVHAPAPGQCAALDAGMIFGVADDRWEIHLPPEAAESPAAELAVNSVPGAASAWQAWEIEAGIPWIGRATQDAFVPQMVDLERLGGVSFTKGCYPGQEIVARSQYLGQVKRRLHAATARTFVLPGTPLVTGTAGVAVGTVVACAPRDDGRFAVLAVVDATLAAGPLATQSDGTEITDLRRLRGEG
jgi:folate-binding protein YgfZ